MIIQNSIPSYAQIPDSCPECGGEFKEHGRIDTPPISVQIQDNALKQRRAYAAVRYICQHHHFFDVVKMNIVY